MKSLEERIGYLEEQKYDGDDLGVYYTESASTFKVWSPLAEEVMLNIYETGELNDESLIEQVSLEHSGNVWHVTVQRDLKGLFYTYSFLHNGVKKEAPDLYSKAVGLNGDRSAIVDLKETNPDGWGTDQQLAQPSITNAFIWETHVADFSSDPNSGISEAHRGKYLAFTETDTSLHNAGEFPTGLQYLKELGINYIHLLPVFDFDNEEQGEEYNWGYDPKNYRVPEGRYATDPSNPSVRIKEFKEMVQSIHNAGIGVVLDVVYNHTSRTKDSWFQHTVPDYYYRQDENGDFADGSACGNETASERKMMRKYMIDTILYWAKEYHLDGFRFDLMGLHDVETMNAIRQSLDAAGLEDVIIYGEPWNAGSVELHEPNKPADKNHIHELDDGIAIFNDEFRDPIKGHVFEKEIGGFLQGHNGEKDSTYSTNDLIASIAANTQFNVGRFHLPEEKAWAKTPSQVVTYASSHDNLSFYDKLVETTNQGNRYDRQEDLLRLNKLSAGLLFTSQGAIFMQAGEEFGRTKYGDENSFRSPLAINRLNWEMVKENQDLVVYYKGMANIRESYAPLRDSTKATADQMVFSDLPENVLAYTIPNLLEDNPKWKMMAVAANTNNKPVHVQIQSDLSLPEEWTIIANKEQAGLHSLGKIKGNTLFLNPNEILVLVG